MSKTISIFHCLLFLFLLLPIMAGAAGTVNLYVGRFLILIDYPLENDTYLSNESFFDINISLDQSTSWCVASVNGGQNLTIYNVSNVWSLHTNINFGYTSLNIFCNDTSNVMFSNLTNFYFENLTEMMYGIIPANEIPSGETIYSYIRPENVKKKTYSRHQSGAQRNITYNHQNLVKVFIENHTFYSNHSNITSAKYEKAPPNILSVTSFTSLTALKYHEVKAVGLSNGTAVINLSYTDSDASGYDENTLIVYRQDNRSWVEANLFARYPAENKISVKENVTVLNYTAFAIVGSPAPVSAPSAPAGVAAGVSGVKIPFLPSPAIKFSVDKDLIKFSILQGETATEKIKIKNEENFDVNFSIFVKHIDRHVIPAEKEFKIKAGETKEIKIYAAAFEDLKPGVYTGFIVVEADSTEKIINIVLEVRTKKALFDVVVEIPPQYTKIRVGEEVLAKIKIFNLGKEKVDVLLKYGIKDMSNNILIEESETVGIETKIETIKSLKIPSMGAGVYVFYALVEYDQTVAASGATFTVIEKIEDIERNITIILLIIVIVAIVLLIIYEYRKHKKLEKLLKRLEKIEPEDLAAE